MRCTLLLATVLLLSGCYTLNKGNVVAQEGQPDHTVVPPVVVERDPSLPTYVLVVEPFRSSSSKVIWTNNQANAVPLEDSMAAQLTTAYSNVENFSLLDASAVKHKGDGTVSAKLEKGEVGPYVVRGVLTEFNETADATASKRGASLGWLGVVAGAAGAIAGKPALGWTGAGLAAANPTFSTEKTARKGVVAFDIQIIDGRNGRIVKSFNSAGTFASEAVAGGVSLFGIGGSEAALAETAIGQAMRAAMNDAVRKTLDALKRSRR